jgi:hypothetical protein
MSQMAMTISLIIIIPMLLLAGILAQHPIQGCGHARALTLLKQWLSPEQLACCERFLISAATAAASLGSAMVRRQTLRNWTTQVAPFADGASRQWAISWPMKSC